MIRKRSKISPLVAAHLRPLRRPPSTATASPTDLRIGRADRSDEQPSLTATTDDRQAEQIRRLADHVEQAEEALGEVHALVKKLEKRVRFLRESRRRPPNAEAILQRDIDSALARIDAIISAVDEEGTRRRAQPSAARPAVDPMSPAQLDRAMISPSDADGLHTERLIGVELAVGKDGGFLSHLRSGGATSVDRAHLGDIQAVLSEAAARIASQQKRLSEFRSGRLEPSLAALAVADENAAAAENAMSDPELARAASRLTGADALVHACRDQCAAANLGAAFPPAATPRFTISR